MENSIMTQIKGLLEKGKAAKETIGMSFKSRTVYHVQAQPMKLSGGGNCPIYA